MINSRPEYQEVGEHIANLLASPHCPQNLREMLEGYLSELYRQTNLLNPEIVGTLFPYLMFASEPQDGPANRQTVTLTKADVLEGIGDEMPASAAY